MKRSTILCLMIGFILTAGCGTPQLNLRIRTNPDTNEGRPFYLLVRTVDDNTYLTESYAEVAKTMFHDIKKTKMKSAVLYPGTVQDIRVYIPDNFETPIAIYFLFSKPGNRWKVFVPPPYPEEMEFALDRDSIQYQR